MEKKNNILLITLVLLIIALVGYLIYDKFIYEDPKVDDVVVEPKDDTYTKYLKGLSVQKNRIEVLVTETVYGAHPISRIVITPDKKVYAVLNEAVIEADNLAIFKNNYLPKLDDLDCDGYGDCTEGYYLGMNNIVKAYVVEQGNGGYNYICFLTKDGEVYAIDTKKMIETEAETASIAVYKVSGLKDIVTIEYWYSQGPAVAYATDINGNIISLYGKLK